MKLQADTLKALYCNGQAETRKTTNAYKVFFFLSLRASDTDDTLSSNGAVLISHSAANFSDVTV